MIASVEGQWLGDIVIREAGSIEAIVEMAIDNDISITDKMHPGSPVRQPAPANKNVVDYYKANNIYPATAAELEEKIFRGIGYMAVEITFIVS